jgi:hypothetical protein
MFNSARSSNGEPVIDSARTSSVQGPRRKAVRSGSRGWTAATLLFVAAQAGAQTAPSQGGGSGGVAAPATVTPAAPAPVPPTAAPPAGDIVRTNPAAPVPNPNLGASAALPARRAFYRAEPFDIYPALGVGLGYTDNLLGQASNEIGTSFLAISPRVQAEVRRGAHAHSVRYGGSYGKYFSSSADDFATHEFVADTVNQFTARTDLRASAYYLLQQDPRGLTTRVISAEPDRWRGLGLNMTAGYGARSAQGRFEADLGITDKQYQNNRSVTAGLDVSTVDLAGRFFYRLSPRVRLLTEYRHTEFDYDSSPLDNSEDRLMVGATWDIAATTMGTAKVGYVKKSFDEPRFADYSALAVDGSLRWMPRTYSFIDIAASRLPSDTSGTGFFNVDTWFAASWTHRWAGYLSSRAVLGRLGQDVRGANRSDTTLSASVAAYFDIRSWMRLGVEYLYQTRDSTDPTFEYSRNQLLFTVGATL